MEQNRSQRERTPVLTYKAPLALEPLSSEREARIHEKSYGYLQGFVQGPVVTVPVQPRTEFFRFSAPKFRGSNFFTPRPVSGAMEGFRNTGNTCYLNSVLCALLHLPAFVHVLQNREMAVELAAPDLPTFPPKSAPDASLVDLSSDVEDAEAPAVPVDIAPILKALQKIMRRRLGKPEVIDPADFKRVSLLSGFIYSVKRMP